jgi:hypothetical protein
MSVAFSAVNFDCFLALGILIIYRFNPCSYLVVFPGCTVHSSKAPTSGLFSLTSVFCVRISVGHDKRIRISKIVALCISFVNYQCPPCSRSWLVNQCRLSVKTPTILSVDSERQECFPYRPFWARVICIYLVRQKFEPCHFARSSELFQVDIWSMVHQQNLFDLIKSL